VQIEYFDPSLELEPELQPELGHLLKAAQRMFQLMKAMA
jgi:hypothetical protein